MLISLKSLNSISESMANNRSMKRQYSNQTPLHITVSMDWGQLSIDLVIVYRMWSTVETRTKRVLNRMIGEGELREFIVGGMIEIGKRMQKRNEGEGGEGRCPGDEKS